MEYLLEYLLENDWKVIFVDLFFGFSKKYHMVSLSVKQHELFDLFDLFVDLSKSSKEPMRISKDSLSIHRVWQDVHIVHISLISLHFKSGAQ